MAPRLDGMRPQIVAGAIDDDGEAHPSVVALRIGETGSYDLCSGALIAPNIVLTARHCVLTSITSDVSCDPRGASTNGDHVDPSRPRTIAIFRGSSPHFGGVPDATGASIVAPPGGSLCDSDIALVVLDRSLDRVDPLAVRLGSGIATGESVQTIGYGMNDKDLPLGTRVRKDGVKVLAKGSGISAFRTALGPHEFELGRSICQGDSGGPAISAETGAIVGVVSRGGSCDDDFGHIYTTTTGWEPLFEEAFARAGGTLHAEAEHAPAESPLLAPDAASPPAAHDASCSAAPGRAEAPGALFLFGVAALVRFRRRAARAVAGLR